MSTKADHIAKLRRNLEKEIKTVQKSEIHNKPKTSEEHTVISDIKRKITGINGIAHKNEFPYDIDNVDTIFFEFEDLEFENKGKNKYKKYALIALLTIAGFTVLTDNSILRMFKQGLPILNSILREQ